MKVEQLYTKCIAEAAYYIESEGEVAIIDPLRETEPYLKMASENNAKIKCLVLWNSNVKTWKDTKQSPLYCTFTATKINYN